MQHVHKEQNMHVCSVVPVLSIRTKMISVATSNFYLSSNSKTRTGTGTVKIFSSELEPELEL